MDAFCRLVVSLLNEREASHQLNWRLWTPVIRRWPHGSKPALWSWKSASTKQDNGNDINLQRLERETLRSESNDYSLSLSIMGKLKRSAITAGNASGYHGVRAFFDAEYWLVGKLDAKAQTEMIGEAKGEGERKLQAPRAKTPARFPE